MKILVPYWKVVQENDECDCCDFKIMWTVVGANCIILNLGLMIYSHISKIGALFLEGFVSLEALISDVALK